MKKKNKSTFSQRAKKIVKSYPRADFDSIEKAALEASLQKLQQEQEDYKAANGMQEQPQQQQQPMMAYGGDFNRFAYMNPNSNLAENTNLPTTLSGNDPYQFGSDNSVYDGFDYVNQEGARPQAGQYLEAPQESTYSPYKTSIAPSLISGATSAIGNMYLANQQKNSPQVNLPRLTPRNISLAKGREAIGREAARGSQRVKQITKGGARTRGEYMSNRLAADAQISSKAGESLSASHEKEALINSNMQTGMDRFNAEMKAKEEMINKAQKIKDKKEREAYIAAAIGAIPQMTRDINATQADDRMINVLGDKYGWYTKNDPNAPFLKRKTKEVRFKG